MLVEKFANSDSNKAIVAIFFDHWFCGRLEEALALVTEDFSLIIPGDPQKLAMAGTYTKNNFVDVLGLISKYMINGVKADITLLMVEGDDAILIGKSSGITLNQKPYENDVCYNLKLRDGKICHIRLFLDTLRAQELVEDSKRF